MKDAEGLGLSIPDEAQVLKGGLALACFYLDGMNVGEGSSRYWRSWDSRSWHDGSYFHDLYERLPCGKYKGVILMSEK